MVFAEGGNSIFPSSALTHRIASADFVSLSVIKGDSNELGNAICEQPWVRKRRVDFTMAEKEPNLHGCMCSYKYHENYEIPSAHTLGHQTLY